MVFAGRFLVVFAVFSASTVLQGCSCGWRPCLFSQKKKTPKKEASTVTEAPTEATTEAPTKAATEAPLVPDSRAERPPNGNGADDIAIYIYNHHKHAFSLLTGRPEKGTWVNRGPPIPNDDWMIDETVHFEESTVVKHGGLAKRESLGTMTLYWQSGGSCTLSYGHDGESKATATSDCGDHVVHTAVDEVNGMSLIFEVNGEKYLPSRAMILLTDAVATSSLSHEAAWIGGGVLVFFSLRAMSRRVATPTIEPAVELGTRC